MESIKIEKLLDQYFDGNTSQADEKILQAYFKKDNVPAHLETYKSMFAYFDNKKAEVSQQEIKVTTKKQPFNFKWSIAAAVLLLMSVVYMVSPTRITDAERQEAQLAYVETQKAFQLISKNLTKGNNAIAHLNDYEITKNKIFKNNN